MADRTPPSSKHNTPQPHLSPSLSYTDPHPLSRMQEPSPTPGGAKKETDDDERMDEQPAVAGEEGMREEGWEEHEPGHGGSDLSGEENESVGRGEKKRTSIFRKRKAKDMVKKTVAALTKGRGDSTSGMVGGGKGKGAHLGDDDVVDRWSRDIGDVFVDRE
nr:hypothetical protein L203_05360 [Cryptococcus depauperatus CBS 7841]